MIGISTKDLERGKVAPISLMSWRSTHMKRKVPSTLSAETFMMSDAMAECNWLRCIWNDTIHDGVDRRWRDNLACGGLCGT